MIDDSKLQTIIRTVQLERFPGRKHRLRAGFYPTRSLKHTIQMRFGLVTVRIAEPFRSVPEEIIRLLGFILLAKLYGQRIDREVRRRYKSYVEDHLLPNHPVKRRVSKRYTAQGTVYNLEERFDRLNRIYFDNSLTKPRIGWSLGKSYRRLGFYSTDRDLLVISRIFDSRRVPVEVLDYLLFHEMLHIHYPAVIKNGRRYVHTRKFREWNGYFPVMQKLINGGWHRHACERGRYNLLQGWIIIRWRAS
jgi:predicted metal-dependent hydrolase